ncbi:hypothetical protein, partial [Desertihabitans aurantiacus]|uniref:hypothetical protein n=1 Tax=Desertihabitans aurantiacus TaxID=2282477 RepID=UPI001300A3DE
MPALDLSPLSRPSPPDLRARVLRDPRRHPTAHRARSRARRLGVLLVVGDVVMAGVVVLSLREESGLLPALGVAAVVLVVMLFGARAITRQLGTGTVERWARLEALARANDLQLADEPRRSDVGGRVLDHPGATITHRLRSETSPDREVGVVRHDLGAGPPRLTRYVALRVPAGTPHLLVSAAEPRQGRPGTV